MWTQNILKLADLFSVSQILNTFSQGFSFGTTSQTEFNCASQIIVGEKARVQAIDSESTDSRVWSRGGLQIHLREFESPFVLQTNLGVIIYG